MKKTFLFASAVAVLFASCSKDKVTGVNSDAEFGNAIDFRTAVQTRGTEITTSNLKEFYVTALDADNANYFTNLKFEDTDSDSYFTSNPSYHWPADGSTLSFYAYAPEATQAGAVVSIDKSAKTIKVTPAQNISQHADFVTANTTGTKENAETGVALEFGHRLSQIEIQAKNGNEGYNFHVTGIKIAQPVSNGSFDLSTNTWTLDEQNTKASYTSTRTGANLTAEYASIMGEGGNAMLIPQQLTAWNPETDAKNDSKGAYLAVLVRITTKDGAVVYPKQTTGDEHAYVAVPIDTNWEAGKKYIYKLDFSDGAGKVDPEDPDGGGEDILGEAIKFTVEVTEWQPGNEEGTELPM